MNQCPRALPPKLPWLAWPAIAFVALSVAAAAPSGWPVEPRDIASEPPLAITVNAPADGLVTLVIDDADGMRVRNLAGPVR